MTMLETRNQVRLEVRRTVPFAGGQSFGDVGPYEWVRGLVHFAADPAEPNLPWICDLDLAPRNAAGLVEFSATFDLVKPVDVARGSGKLLYEFSNRGGKSVLNQMNEGGRGAMSQPAAAGTGFLMHRGYTLAWSGWQGDLIDRGNNTVAHVPFAQKAGQPLRGRVRQEFSTVKSGILSLGVSEGAERGEDVQPYPVLDRATATLTVREHEADPRIPVPDDQWELVHAELKADQVVVTPSNEHLYIHGGFKPGWIYELIYDTEGSRVMGLGFLGVRDFLSLLRYGTHDSVGGANPMAGGVQHVYGTGTSLSGRVVRQYVYEGWNVDAQGRRIFDGVHTHTGSGRLLHNMRFSQVGRYPRQHEEHQWPAEYYPFSFQAVPDPFTAKHEALWQRPESDPLVIHTHTEGDYWVRHVSLTHTDPRDASDLPVPPYARMYHLTATPHMARPADDPVWIGQLQPSTMSANAYRRWALEALDRWVTEGAPPPPSLLPRIDDGTLVTAEEALARFPRIPGVNLPQGPSRLPRHDYGPDFDSRGLMTVLPPHPVPGQEYPVRVPQVDADGNCIAGLRYPDVEVPLGTYTGWALRRAGFAEGDQFWNTGSFIPFARTRAEREASGDPRPSIEERYPSHAAYVERVAAVCAARVREDFLLQDDADRYVAAARAKNPLDPTVPLGPLVAVLVAPGG